MRRKVLHPYTRLPTYALRFPPCPPALSLHAAVAYCLSGRAGSPPLGGQYSFCFSAGDGAPAALSTGSSPRLCCAPARAGRGEHNHPESVGMRQGCAHFFLFSTGLRVEPRQAARGCPSCRRRIPTVWDVDCQTARERRPISDSAVFSGRAARPRLAPAAARSARGISRRFFTRFRAPWRGGREG